MNNHRLSYNLVSKSIQIIQSIEQFYLVDYRVRLCIADYFIKKIADDLKDWQNNDPEAQDWLLQCAFCYEIGFGVARDRERTQSILKRCGRHEIDFYYEINLLRLGERKFKYKGRNFVRLKRESKTQRVDVAETLPGGQSLESVELEYRSEISDVTAALGPGHEIVTILKAQLSEILRRHRQPQKAGELTLEIIETKYNIPTKYPDLLNNYHNLACALLDLGKLEEAADLQKHIIDRRKQMLGEDHPQLLNSIGLLAQIYKNQSRWDEAERMEIYILAKTKSTFGEKHLLTLQCMMRLASTLWTLGRANAEELRVKATETARQVLGDDHVATATTMTALADIYIRQARWNEAEDLIVPVIAAEKKLFGEEHVTTQTSILRLACNYQGQERYEEAEILLKQVIKTMAKALGEGDRRTLRSMETLAKNYWFQGQREEAERLGLQVIDISSKELGPRHPHTLERMVNLALRYSDWKQMDESEKLQEHVIQDVVLLLGQEHPCCGPKWPCNPAHCSVMNELSRCLGIKGPFGFALGRPAYADLP